jgi:hypothetical protein
MAIYEKLRRVPMIVGWLSTPTHEHIICLNVIDSGKHGSRGGRVTIFLFDVICRIQALSKLHHSFTYHYQHGFKHSNGSNSLFRFIQRRPSFASSLTSVLANSP